MTNFFPRVDTAAETLRNSRAGTTEDATRRKEAEERAEAANLPKPVMKGPPLQKSRAQAYLDGDAVSVPLSFEIARDCVRLEAENARLRAALREIANEEAAIHPGYDRSYRCEGCEEVISIAVVALDALETKGGDNGE